MILKKTDNTCSNIDLIDENQCLGDSLNIINSNFNILSSNLTSLSRDMVFFNNLYTIFSNLSTTTLNTVNHIKSIQSSYSNCVNTINRLSPSWNKDFSLTYPKFLEINDFHNNETTYNSYFINWLNSNFSPNDYLEYQKVYLFINTYQVLNFNFKFDRYYYELCTPNKGGGSVSCVSCPDTRYQQCNITGAGCRNAYSYCAHSTSTESVVATCIGSGGRNLHVGMNVPLQDTCFAQVIKKSFTNNGSTWNLD